MAKQSGLHQIKGKIGEHSYYRQTGVSGGLIRSINQGLSDRVKNDEAYANTRLNNQEFGAACNVAAILGKCVTPKFRPMILPFSQSKMAKEILKVARANTENWGQRVVTSSDTAKLCEILSAMSKRDYTEFFSAEVTANSAIEINVKAGYSSPQASLMESLGINRTTVEAAEYDLGTGQWLPFAQEMSTSYVDKIERETLFDAALLSPDGNSSDNDLEIGTFVPAPNHTAHRIVVFVFMPIREVNGVNHILQEYCSFVAMPVPTYVP